MANILSRRFFDIPDLPSIWNNIDDLTSFVPSFPSGLSISEDDKNVYVDAQIPGLDPQDVEITYDKGILWIKGEKKEEEEDKKRKYIRRASRSFSYRVALPNEVDDSIQPDASYKNGLLTVTFTKSKDSKPKSIPIKIKEK